MPIADKKEKSEINITVNFLNSLLSIIFLDLIKYFLKYIPILL